MDDTITIKENMDDMITSIIDVQEQQGIEIKNLSLVVNAIRESIMNDKKILLKKMIYDALEQGYVTPEQDERIRLEYASYTGLHGNGLIKDLYEHKFQQLPIREQ